MTPEQMLALLTEIADLRIQGQMLLGEAQRLQQENDELRAAAEKKTKRRTKVETT